MNYKTKIGLFVLMAIVVGTFPAPEINAELPEQQNENTKTIHDGDSSSTISYMDYQLLDSYHWTDPHCHIDTGVGCNVKTT